MTKFYKGKALYSPTGKALEYSYWGCNFYVGCPNGCDYCYCKKSVLATAMGGDKATLKKCFTDEKHAFNVFVEEVRRNLDELKKHSVFFSFSTDPMLPETKRLTLSAAEFCLMNHIPVKILTKRTDWIVDYNFDLFRGVEKEIAFGFTLTGEDSLEPHASLNSERIKTMEFLHKKGYRTFASIEPIVNIKSSMDMIFQTVDFCDLYKIGLMSGKTYDAEQLAVFIIAVINEVNFSNLNKNKQTKIYFKDSIIEHMKRAGIKIDREKMMASHDVCVRHDYDLFKNIETK